MPTFLRCPYSNYKMFTGHNSGTTLSDTNTQAFQIAKVWCPGYQDYVLLRKYTLMCVMAWMEEAGGTNIPPPLLIK